MKFIDIKWFLLRKKEHLEIAIAWALPKTILKWALVRCAVNVPDSEAYPGSATYTQMCKFLKG